MTQIKVEFEVKGFGEDTIKGYEGSYKGVEVVRIKSLSKDTTLEEIETIIYQLFEEIQLSYEKQPEQLVAKIIIRAKKKKQRLRI